MGANTQTAFTLYISPLQSISLQTGLRRLQGQAQKQHTTQDVLRHALTTRSHATTPEPYAAS